MSLTPEQIAKIRQKEAEKPDALKRDPNVNYYEGWFFVTLNTRNNVPVLSTLEGDVSVDDGEPTAPHCLYTELGKGVKEAWTKIPTFCKTAKVDICEAMPDHFHGLIHLLPGNKRHLGHILGGFMGGCSHIYWDTLGIDWHKNRFDQGANALRVDRDRDHMQSFRGPALFVHGYNDMEPITQDEVNVKRAYILNNPRKRMIQRDRHLCFRKYRHQHSSNWTAEMVMSAICADRTFYYDAIRQETAITNILARLNRDAAPETSSTRIITLPSGKQVSMPGIGLDYIGNRALLYSDKKLPLVCHRADAAQFEQQKAAVLSAARNGCIIVSAFISPKERDIRLQLMVEQLPFIEILDNGIPDKYKGVGKAFYALAENRLCQITPWQYQYQKDVKVTREMCLVMNHLARIISGVLDDWWKAQRNRIFEKDSYSLE